MQQVTSTVSQEEEGEPLFPARALGDSQNPDSVCSDLQNPQNPDSIRSDLQNPDLLRSPEEELLTGSDYEHVNQNPINAIYPALNLDSGIGSDIRGIGIQSAHWVRQDG